MFDPSRDQVRRFFLQSHVKQRQGLALSAMEQMAADIVTRHPEYHALFEGDEATLLSRDWHPEEGRMNPFLHLSLHLALEEQLGIDKPPGIRAIYEQQCRLAGDEHEARHRLLDCLGQMIWECQRQGVPPNPERYLELLHKLVGR